MSFKWHTEEERGWDHEVTAPAARAGSENRRRLVLLALVMLIAGAAVWRTVQVRAERNLQILEQEVRSSVALAQRAATQGDEELLTAVLSGRDDSWTQMQLRLLAEELLFGRAATPFGVEHDGNSATIEDISWSPDLQQALVTNRYIYTLQSAEEAGATVSLQQTVVLRRGAERWLLAPPDGEFWGPWQSQEGEHVTLTFRERDAQAAAQMLPVLDEAMAALCAALARPCPRNGRLSVELDDGGEALWRLQDDRYPRFRSGELSLPSPSLVGYSSDPGAQRVLFHGYAVYMLVAAAQELLDFDCCQGAQFMDALAEELAHDLGYGPGPLHSVDYLDMVDTHSNLRQFDQLWWGSYVGPFNASDRAQVAAFNEFLRRQSGASTAELQVALSNAYGFWGWIQPFVAHDVVDGRTALETSWRDFVIAQANAAQEDLPSYMAMPEQFLKLICEDDVGQRGLYHFDPVQERWTYERAVLARLPVLAPTPGDDGVVLFDRLAGDPTRMPARLLHDGRAIPLPGDLAPAYSLPVDPQGRFMPMWRIAQSGRTVDGALLLDLERCMGQGGCQEVSLSGLPAWSPSGEQMLLWTTESGRIVLMTRDFQRAMDTPVRSSQQPFWLDELTVGLISADGGAIQTVGLRDPSTAQELLTLAPVMAALGREGDGRNWRFAQGYRIPGEQWAVVGAVMLPESGARHYFMARFDVQGRPIEIAPLSYVPQLTVTSPEALISADGAWLALHLFPEAQLEAGFVLHDLQRGKVVLKTRSPYFNAQRAHDWSADGQWLARIGPYYIELATGSGDEEQPLLRRFISSGQLQCSSVVWVHK